MTLAQTERASLADLFAELGPDQPTLCAGWDTGDLMAHLLVRERRLDAALGMFVKPLADWMAHVSAGFARRPWTDQIHLLRTGPPPLSPLGWGSMDDKANSMEMFIHHEDARRGQPDWQPRELSQDTRDQLIKMITSPLALRSLRRAGVPVTARLTGEPGQREMPINLVPAKEIDGAGNSLSGVVLLGGVAEILLWLSGRSQVRLEFEGDPAAIAAARAGERQV